MIVARSWSCRQAETISLGAGAVAVDEDGDVEGLVAVLFAAVGAGPTGGAAHPRLHGHEFLLADEHLADVGGGGEVAARVAAEVEHDPVETALLEAVDRGAKIAGRGLCELRQADVADLVLGVDREVPVGVLIALDAEDGFHGHPVPLEVEIHFLAVAFDDERDRRGGLTGDDGDRLIGLHALGGVFLLGRFRERVPGDVVDAANDFHDEVAGLDAAFECRAALDGTDDEQGVVHGVATNLDADAGGTGRGGRWPSSARFPCRNKPCTGR